MVNYSAQRSLLRVVYVPVIGPTTIFDYQDLALYTAGKYF
jgi:hypothetical protein